MAAAIATVLACTIWAADDPAAEQRFRERVAPLLERRCLNCHNDGIAKGQLSLQSQASLAKGGESGPAIIPGNSLASALLAAVAGEQPAMPKTGGPLTVAEVAAIREWIESGAAWPPGIVLEERPPADLNWWSLKPLVRPAVPLPSRFTASGSSQRAAVDQRDEAIRSEDPRFENNPIDRFIQAALSARGLGPSPAADRRTLIRRLSFDLIGLPPTPEEIDAFVTDPQPHAYERLVDRLLASPQYGERWARHWLDVVHYGDTHGYDKDQPRPNAWPYRDYVIRAFNEDKPYGQFIREQLAGDRFAPDTVDGVTALGFIAAGPWDFISHVEVPESKIDGQIARSLDRDDMVVNTFNTFCSTTVQCARCHAHKFDPISQADYYRLQAVFAAVDRADKPFDLDPAVAARRRQLSAQEQAAVAELARVERQIAEQCGPELAALNQRLADSDRAAKSPATAPPEFGYHSAIETAANRAKWVQVDFGEPTDLVRVVLIPCHDDFNKIGAGFGFPLRYRLDASDDPEFRDRVTVLVDLTAADQPNPGLTPQSFACASPKRRYLRLTATKLALRQNDFILAVSELQAYDSAGINVAQGKPVMAIDSIESAPRWRKSNLVDDRYPSAANMLASTERDILVQRIAQLQERVPSNVRAAAEQLSQRVITVREELKALPGQQRVYAGTVHSGTGNFVGTGAKNGMPRPIHVLARGDVRKPLKEVAPGVPPLIPGVPGVLALREGHSEAERRMALAEWVADEQNSLTWRSIANRVWQYHFGRGLVDSPNDFGRMGQAPTHPELLDWLACDVRDHGSLKRLHQLIVTSHTYRQSSADRPECSRVDAQNAFLWRANRRKLDAEAIRDSLLFVAGRLDDRMGGPGFQDFVVVRPEHSPHYEYQLHDPHDVRTHRRSVYRFIVRSQPQPFMATLDCADPSMSVDKRNETINPLQALALLNNGLTVVMAEAFAEKAGRDRPVDLVLSSALLRAIGRSPTADEQAILVDYAKANGLANTCRVILNMNEFAFVD